MKKLIPIVLTAILCLTLCTVSVVAFSHANGFAFTPPAASEPCVSNSPEEIFAEIPIEATTEVLTDAQTTVLYIYPDGSVNRETVDKGLLTLPTCNLPADGQVFKGWKVSGDEFLYSEGDSLLITDAEVVVTAVFGPKAYHISLYNGDDVISVECDDESYVLPEAESLDKGKIFSGWSPRQDDHRAVWQAGEAIDITADVSLYAIFEARSYTISFLAGEGSGSAKLLTCLHGEEIRLEANGFAKSKSTVKGYTDQNNNYYAVDTAVTVKEDMTLTAAYALNHAFSVRVNDLINYDALYEVNLRQYIDLDELVREGATQMRITWTQTATAGKGKCIPSLDIYCGQPVKNRNVFLMDHNQVATYTSTGRIFATDFSYTTSSFSTKTIDLSEIIESGCVSIYYKALAFMPGDVANNQYYIDASFTIEVF